MKYILPLSKKDAELLTKWYKALDLQKFSGEEVNKSIQILALLTYMIHAPIKLEVADKHPTTAFHGTLMTCPHCHKNFLDKVNESDTIICDSVPYEMNDKQILYYELIICGACEQIYKRHAVKNNYTGIHLFC